MSKVKVIGAIILLVAVALLAAYCFSQYPNNPVEEPTPEPVEETTVEQPVEKTTPQIQYSEELPDTGGLFKIGV